MRGKGRSLRKRRGKGWSLRLRGGRGEAKAGAFAYARGRGEAKAGAFAYARGRGGAKAGAFAYVGCDGKKTADNVLPYQSVGDWPDGFFKA
jgi:hypothetical protein